MPTEAIFEKLAAAKDVAGIKAILADAGAKIVYAEEKSDDPPSEGGEQLPLPCGKAGREAPRGGGFPSFGQMDRAISAGMSRKKE